MNAKLKFLAGMIQSNPARAKQIWNNVSSPMWEPQDNGLYKVTFLYRSPYSEDVSLDCLDLNERIEGEDAKTFTQIAGTDLYYLEIDNIPSETCIPYQINIGGKSKSDQLNSLPEYSSVEFDIYKSTVVHNKKTSSILAGPDADPNPDWMLHQSMAHGLMGEVRHDKFKDKNALFGERDIWLYKPYGFDARDDPKILFVLDGEEYIKYLPLFIEQNNASESGRTPFDNTVVVFIANRPQFDSGLPSRINDFLFQIDDFSACITKEIIPQYCDQYGIEFGLRNISLAGFSLAGFFAAKAALDNPEQIDNLILISPALNNHLPPNHNDSGKTMMELYSSDEAPKNFQVHMQIGSLEDVVVSTERQKIECLIDSSRLEANRSFFTTLTENGFNVDYQERAHGHSYLTSISAISSGMRSIIPRVKQVRPK